MIGYEDGGTVSHSLEDVDNTLAVGTAMHHILTSIDAERDTTAKEEPKKRQ